MKAYKPLPDNLEIGKSKIHGQGLIAKEDIPIGTELGITHYRKGDKVIRTPLGGFINHNEEPNCLRIQIRIEPYWDKWSLKTIQDLKKGDELTLKYIMYRVDNVD
jgi:SET domain-containing protein